jgi:sigma-B regulation protein RsbU (phosphoserine phosphatase)
MMEKRSPCILLVDDEKNITKALARELEDWAKERTLEILSADSARSGLDILLRRGADTVVIVSDLKMPEMQGSDFLLEVKRLYPHIVSILLTGYSETEEVIKAVSAGIFSYILKPWDSGFLLAQLDKAYEFGELRRRDAQHLKAIEEELKWAGEFQKALLKPNLPSSAGVEFRVSYRPVPGLYCGGDYYDVIMIGQDRYLLLIGDVEGHGAKGAFVTGILKATIYSEYVRAAAGKNFSPGAFLGWLNERMNFEFRSASSLIITFFAGVLDIKAGSFLYSSAGHNHPYLLQEGSMTELPVSGSALGFARAVSYTERRVELSPGDSLLLFTDGLVEIDCAAGREPLRLGPLLEGMDRQTDFHRKLLEAALREAAAPDFTDDVTLLTARIL